MNSLLQQQQIYKKHLIFECHFGKGTTENKPLLNSASNVWSNRIVLIGDKDNKNYEFLNFIAFDLLMNESRPIRFCRTNESYVFEGISSLNDELGLIIEVNGRISRLNFVKFDWDTNEFQLIQHFELNYRASEILVDKLDTSKFVLKSTNDFSLFNYQIGKLINGKIELGENFQSRYLARFYHNNTLIDAYSFEITTYDLSLKEEKLVKLDKSLLPENVNFLYSYYEWIKDRLYAAIKYEDTEHYGLAWTNLTQKRWGLLLDFNTNLEIEKLKFSNGNLIVDAKNNGRNGKVVERKIYAIQMRRPQFLRQKAWLCVVKIMKDRKEKDPYEAAKEFLPLNSDLREAWFKDEEKIKKN